MFANIRDIVDEIIVVDSGSTDRTAEVARQNSDVFVEHAFENFSKQKNYAASLAKNPWILNIDADELLSDELKQRIVEIQQERTPRYQAYCFPRKDFWSRWKHAFQYCFLSGISLQVLPS